MIQFPSQLDDKEQLLRLLGGYWSNTYEGQELLGELLKTRASLTKQVFNRLEEAVNCRSRIDIPVYRGEAWLLLTIKKSTVESFPNLYGESVNYNQGAVYGKRSADLPFVYPIDSAIAECSLITNRLSNSSVNLVSGLDFVVDNANHLIRFKANPFNNDAFQSQLTEDGDEEVFVWLYKPQIDKEYLWKHFGYVINLWAKSGQYYKDLINNVYDSIVLGTSAGKTLDAISATTGIPLAKGNETVEVIDRDKDNKLVITDKNVYRFSLNDTILVSVGDELVTDQSLSDGLLVYEFNRGIAPTDVNGVSVSRELMPGSFLGEIGFPNRYESTVVTSDTDGRTVITFPLGGHPFDVEAFWTEVHNRGLESGLTLANRLDQRDNREDEPTAAYLPSQINPFELLVQNIYRFGAFLVKIKTSSVSPTAAGIDKLSYVRRLLPPHTTMLLVIDMPSVVEDVILEEDANNLDSFTTANTLETETGPTSLQDIITGRVVSGNCL